MKTPLYIDAGYNKLLQPPVYAGFVYGTQATVIELHESFWDEDKFPVSSTEAEYYGLIYALFWLHGQPPDDIMIYSDSQVLVRQVAGTYQCRVPRLEALLNFSDYLWFSLLKKGFLLELRHIPRERNIADSYIRKVRKGK